jgi:UTP:GlnB (protein PII) uridylyltransferase
VPVIDSGDLPIADPAEVQEFLRGLPLALDREFTRFVLGFPRKYLALTPRAEIVKHYGLAASLGSKAVISSLAKDGEHWKLSLVTRDRKALFSRLAGALTCHGMNITAAEAFANASAVVLDTFRFTDDERHFDEDDQRRSFQGFLEDAVEGKVALEPRLRERLGRLAPVPEAFAIEMDDDSHPSATRVRLECADRVGLLYVVSRCISEAGLDIELASVDTAGGRVHDEFYVTRAGGFIGSPAREDLARRLADLGRRYFRGDAAALVEG